MTSSLTVTAVDEEHLTEDLRDEALTLDGQLRRTQRLAAVGTITAMIVHELNNILTTVIGRTDLARTADEAGRKKGLEAALEAYTRAGTICQALLNLTGGDSEKVESVTVAELFDQTLAALARDPAKDGIVLIRKVPPGLRVRTRPVELQQVLLNLLINARDAVLEKGRGKSISISASRRSGEVIIRVADTGVGIPREIRGRVFEPFFTTKTDGGTGLGLAVCRQIVQSLNGRITVRSQPGKGACFTVALPG